MKTDTIHSDDGGMESLQEPLLEVQPIPVPPPVTIDAEAMPAPVVLEATTTTVTTEDADGDVEGLFSVVSIEIDESDWDHGEVQPKAFRDCFWAVLFLLQLGAVVTLAVMGIVHTIQDGVDWLPSSDSSSDNSDNDDEDKHVLWFWLALFGTVIAVPSALLNLLLGPFSSMLIQFSLILSPLSFFIAFVASFATMNCPVAFFSLIMCVIGAFYAVRVWHKVPFATANVQTALAAIQDNHGLWIIAYLVTAKSYVWIILWFAAAVQLNVYQQDWIYDCTAPEIDDGDDICTTSTRGKFIGFGMLLSLFWTSQVISNIFHTTIAGVVGTWWFDPAEARSASALGNGSGGFCGCCGCSPAIVNSWIRSGCHSLGSIAFGSLLVGILKVLQLVVRCGRSQRDQQRRMRGLHNTDFVFCLLQFFVDHLERLLEYINVWAYVYVGLYGYDYWTAGKQVAGLFKARGWDVIITDNLVERSLSLMSLLISLITGLVGMLLGFCFLGLSGGITAFFLGFVLGGSSAQILFGVVTSAVNTVVVCFAESPNQLTQNGHDPKHFRNLVDAYRQAYPNDCGF